MTVKMFNFNTLILEYSMIQIADLKPSLLWKYFSEILNIPRASKKEEKIVAYLINFAEEKKLLYTKDLAGNIVIRKPATSGCENKKMVILQSHVDMVCEKNADTKHNFDEDPIDAFIDDGWVKARGTTLGADNGIGIAAQLAVLADTRLRHGPIECLFTVDEESGLTGANRLESDFISGKYLINLDSEDEGELFIGCAGGMDTMISFPFKTKVVEFECTAYTVWIKGLIGGHSGDDINKGRGNANKILARYLWNIHNSYKIGLFTISGGNLRNAIPREASAGFVVKNSKKQELIEFTKNFESVIRNEIKSAEPNLQIVFEETNVPEQIMTNKSISRLLNALHACPNGVVEMSYDISGLVQTSSNLASIKIVGNNEILIVTSQRSSIESAKQNVADRIRGIFLLTKAQVRHADGYPGWTPNTNSELLKITKAEYTHLFRQEPEIKAIHAGLECGLFLKKYPRLDMISFGPTIKGAHSPDEKLDIDSVKKFWQLLTGVLEKIPA
jgi:dipeptidase D